MNWFETINLFYPNYWNKKMVGDAVKCKKITAEEYKKITGDDYAAPVE